MRVTSSNRGVLNAAKAQAEVLRGLFGEMDGVSIAKHLCVAALQLSLAAVVSLVAAHQAAKDGK